MVLRNWSITSRLYRRRSAQPLLGHDMHAFSSTRRGGAAGPGKLFVTELLESHIPAEQSRRIRCTTARVQVNSSFLAFNFLLFTSFLLFPRAAQVASEVLLFSPSNSPLLRSQRHILYIPRFTVRRRRFYPHLSYPSIQTTLSGIEHACTW
jgi:hypothetical protein